MNKPPEAVTLSAKTKMWNRWLRTDISLLNAMMEPESDKKKKCTWISALITSVLTSIPASIYFARLSSVHNM